MKSLAISRQKSMEPSEAASIKIKSKIKNYSFQDTYFKSPTLNLCGLQADVLSYVELRRPTTSAVRRLRKPATTGLRRRRSRARPERSHQRQSGSWVI